jgi:hypothetical protein
MAHVISIIRNRNCTSTSGTVLMAHLISIIRNRNRTSTSGTVLMAPCCSTFSLGFLFSVTSFISVSCARWFLSLWIVHSTLHLRVSLTFSYLKFLLINKCMTIQHTHICYKLKVSMELQMFWKHSNTSLIISLYKCVNISKVYNLTFENRL